MKTRFFKITEMNVSSYVKVPLRSSAILNIENDDKYCFLCSLKASLNSSSNSDPNIVSKYRQ